MAWHRLSATPPFSVITWGLLSLPDTSHSLFSHFHVLTEAVKWKDGSQDIQAYLSKAKLVIPQHNLGAKENTPGMFPNFSPIYAEPRDQSMNELTRTPISVCTK